MACCLSRMHSVRAATELEGGGGRHHLGRPGWEVWGASDSPNGPATPLHPNDLLGVVVAILGVDIKLLTLQRNQKERLQGNSHWTVHPGVPKTRLWPQSNLADPPLCPSAGDMPSTSNPRLHPRTPSPFQTEHLALPLGKGTQEGGRPYPTEPTSPSRRGREASTQPFLPFPQSSWPPPQGRYCSCPGL